MPDILVKIEWDVPTDPDWLDAPSLELILAEVEPDTAFTVTLVDDWLERHDADVRAQERERCAGKCDAAAEKAEQNAKDFRPEGSIYWEWMNRAEGYRKLAAAIREEE